MSTKMADKHGAILPCKCKNEYQDSKYGTGMRVATPLKKKSLNDSQRYSCTVCNSQLTI